MFWRKLNKSFYYFHFSIIKIQFSLKSIKYIWFINRLKHIAFTSTQPMLVDIKCIANDFDILTSYSISFFFHPANSNPLHSKMKELRTGNSYECAVKRMASKCFNMGMAVMPQRTHPA